MNWHDVFPKFSQRLDPITQPPTAPVFSDYDLSDIRPNTSGLKQAAVLVPLVEREKGLNVILTRRATDLSKHAGQIAFPGGRRDETDSDVAATALREAHEEIGLDPGLVRVLGVSDAYETVTGYAVTPVVGLVDPAAVLNADAREVAEIFEVPLAFLMDPINHLPQSRTYNGVARRFYAMPYGTHYIWGATAGMLRALYQRVFA